MINFLDDELRREYNKYVSKNLGNNANLILGDDMNPNAHAMVSLNNFFKFEHINKRLVRSKDIEERANSSFDFQNSSILLGLVYNEDMYRRIPTTEYSTLTESMKENCLRNKIHSSTNTPVCYSLNDFNIVKVNNESGEEDYILALNYNAEPISTTTLGISSFSESYLLSLLGLNFNTGYFNIRGLGARPSEAKILLADC